MSEVPEDYGLNPLWELFPAEEIPEADELRDEEYLEYGVHYAPTDWVPNRDHELEFQNESTLYGVYKDTGRVHGHDGLALAEMLQTGWEWGYESFTPYTMSRETLDWLRPRIVKKINDRYYFRDLGTMPPNKWAHLFRIRLTEILDRLGPLYEQVHDGLDILDKGLDQSKSISVNSDFPQARLLMEQEDYASDSTETSVQSTGKNAQLESLIRYQRDYQELDKQVLDYVSVCFSSFVTPTNF